MGFGNPLSPSALAAAIAATKLSTDAPTAAQVAAAIAGQTLTTNAPSAAQLASAIAGQTLTVSGQVTTNNNPTPASDEDDVRVYNQATIDGLTAADKATNFVIYNTTTSAVNYCVAGQIVVPSAPSAPSALTGRIALTGYQLPASTGTWATYTIALSRAVSAATVQIGQNSGFGVAFDVNSTDTLRTRWLAVRSDNTVTVANLSAAAGQIGFNFNDQNPTTRALLIRNAVFGADFKSITWEWAFNGSLTPTLGSDSSVVWTAN